MSHHLIFVTLVSGKIPTYAIRSNDDAHSFTNPLNAAHYRCTLEH